MAHSHHIKHSSGYQDRHRGRRHRARSEAHPAEKETHAKDKQEPEQEAPPPPPPAEPGPWSDWQQGENGLWFWQARLGVNGQWEYQFMRGYPTAKRTLPVYSSRGLCSAPTGAVDTVSPLALRSMTIPTMAPVQEVPAEKFEVIQGVDPETLEAMPMPLVKVVAAPSAAAPESGKTGDANDRTSGHKHKRVARKVHSWLSEVGKGKGGV